MHLLQLEQKKKKKKLCSASFIQKILYLVVWSSLIKSLEMKSDKTFKKAFINTD